MLDGHFTPEDVTQAFLSAPPLISSTILDFTIKHPNWMRDVPEMEEVPLGNGTKVDQLIFRGGMPVIERGFDRWKKLPNNTGCAPCDGPDCSYNMTMFGGHGFDRRTVELGSREFRSPTYCVKEIQTTAHFKQVFEKITENLYRQTDFFKEENIVHNALIDLSKKFVIDGGGAKGNRNNPYSYPGISNPAVRLSALNVDALQFFYDRMRRLSDVVPYDVVDGSPVFALLASHDVLSRMWRDDPQLRQDIRFSGLANELLTKYNFMNTVRGMYFPVPILYPRRFNLDSGGNFVEVLPFINDVPMEVGAGTENNPDWEVANYEEVLIHGRAPFKLLYQLTETTLGSNTSFGPEEAFMNTWSWVNPVTVEDPYRRSGFFINAATMGVAPQFSSGLFGIVVERASYKLMAMYTPNPNCPVDPPDCSNIIDDPGCPCPVVLSITKDLFTANQYTFVFATGLGNAGDDAPYDAGDTITLAYDSGVQVSGTIEAITTDLKTASILFTSDLPAGACSSIVEIVCGSENWAQCSATVLELREGRSNQLDQAVLVLSNAILADEANDVFYGYMGDGTIQHFKVISISGLETTFTYATGYGPTDDPTGAGSSKKIADVVEDRGGISKVCVPTATDASCPGCDATLADCS